MVTAWERQRQGYAAVGYLRTFASGVAGHGEAAALVTGQGSGYRWVGRTGRLGAAVGQPLPPHTGTGTGFGRPGKPVVEGLTAPACCDRDVSAACRAAQDGLISL